MNGKKYALVNHIFEDENFSVRTVVNKNVSEIKNIYTIECFQVSLATFCILKNHNIAGFFFIRIRKLTMHVEETAVLLQKMFQNRLISRHPGFVYPYPNSQRAIKRFWVNV